MITSEILAVLLFIIISQIGHIQLKVSYLNHRITAIEERLRSCGIVALDINKEGYYGKKRKKEKNKEER